MASRILGFFLGLIFTFLGSLLLIAYLLPGFVEQIPYVGSIIVSISSFGDIYSIIIGLIMLVIGLFALQSSIRDAWPFFG